jgi:hypothetical protein
MRMVSANQNPVSHCFTHICYKPHNEFSYRSKKIEGP